VKKLISGIALPACIGIIIISAISGGLWYFNVPLFKILHHYRVSAKFNSAISFDVVKSYFVFVSLTFILVIDLFNNNRRRKNSGEPTSENISSDDRFYKTLENMIEGCQIIDRDFRYVYVNKVAAAHGRKLPSELIGRTMMEMYPGIENTRMFSELRCCMDTGRSRRIENEFINSDGSKSWFDLFIQSVPEGIFILSLDITERKNMESEKQRINEELEQKVKERTIMLETVNNNLEKEIFERKRAQDGIQRSNRELSVLYQINCAIAESLDLKTMIDNALNVTLDVLNIEAGGIYLVEADEETLALRVHRGHGDEFIRSIKCLKVGEGISGKAVAEKHPVVIDISDYPTERLSPLMVGEGFQTMASFPLLSAGQAVGAFNMGTRRVRAFPPGEMELLSSIGQQLGNAVQNARLYSTLRERTAQLEAANRELEAFSYSVSHDLRAPLRAIDGFSRFLQEDYEEKLDAEGKRLLNVIRSNTQKMDHLISDLLALSRVTRNELVISVIDMRTMVDSIYHEIIPDSVSGKFHFTVDQIPAAYGDPSFMRQVWYNLLSNAVKYTMPKENCEITVGGYDENEFHVYFIKDNGVGFNQEYTHKLFGVFQRLHKTEDFEGTGVGLAIVQRIVHRHGGTIWAEGKTGEGAAFYFSIPRKERKHDQPKCSGDSSGGGQSERRGDGIESPQKT